MSTTTNPNPQTKDLAKKGVLSTVQELLEKFQGQIKVALPRHMTAERMIRVALTAVSQSPLLQKCNPYTLCGAVVQASILGLEPNSALGECFLIPYWSTKAGGYECQLQVGYKGIVKLARNSGEIAMVDAQPVYENDTFEFEKGDAPFLKHKWAATGDRGSVIGYWAGFKTKDQTFNFEYWPMDQIFDHRDQYSQGAFKKERGNFVRDKDGNRILQGPWLDSPDWMCRKTVLIQVLKLAPKSVQVATAISLDERSDAGVAQQFSIDVPLELQPPSDDDDPHAGEKPLQEPKRKGESKPAAKEDPQEQLPMDPMQETPQKIIFDSWEQVEQDFNGDRIAPGLGLHILVGSEELKRSDTSETWKKVKAK